MDSAFIDHDFQNCQQPPLLINREILQLSGDGAAFLARSNVQYVGKKMVGVALERVDYGDEGVQFRCLKPALDVADISCRQINHLCKLRLREITCFLRFLSAASSSSLTYS